MKLAEQAQLFLLENRLKEIKSVKRNYIILTFVIATSIIISWTLRGYDFITGWVIWVILGPVVSEIFQYYYGKKEAEVIWQIQQIANGK